MTIMIIMDIWPHDYIIIMAMTIYSYGMLVPHLEVP
jgi:hypothetical protein